MIIVLQIAVLTLLYALALASFAPLDLATGALLSAGSLAAARQLHAHDRLSVGDAARRLAGVPVLAAAILREVVVGTWGVALTVIGVRSAERADVVAVPFDGRSPAGVATSAIAFTLAPGDVILDVDWDREVMLVHVLDASDPAAVRLRFRHFYERYQRRVVP